MANQPILGTLFPGFLSNHWTNSFCSCIDESEWRKLAPIGFSLLPPFYNVHLELWKCPKVSKWIQDENLNDLMLELSSNLGTVRFSRIGLVYNELVHRVSTIFGNFVTSLPTIHSTIIFVCIKYVPVLVVTQGERFLFKRVCPRNYKHVSLYYKVWLQRKTWTITDDRCTVVRHCSFL